MGEEIRRSGRATKGQHTKNVEDAEPEPPKRTTKGKASKGKAKKVEASPEPGSDEDEGFVRCICGATEEDEDEDISWVACDKCGAWQHTDCMGLTNTDFEGKNYFCEQCRPQDHKELLVKIKRGEKPWEQARQRQEEKKQKKGKRGRKSKASEVQQEPEPEPVNIAPVAEAIQVEGLGTGGRQKRKLGDDSPAVAKTPEATEPQRKVRKVSSPVVEKVPESYGTRRKSGNTSVLAKRESKGVELQTELVDKISDLKHESRRRIAEALVKALTIHIKAAQSQGTFTLSPGQTPDAYGSRLGLNVEYALYMSHWSKDNQPTEAYRTQYGRITQNLKANPNLRDRVLSRELSANELAKMSSADMASKEQKEEAERIRKESEKQHVLIQEEGPRIRRTHKGEEIVGDVSHSAGMSDSVYSNAPLRRRESEVDPEKKSETPAQTPNTPNIPSSSKEISTAKAESPGASQRQPLAVDTKAHVSSPPSSGRQGSGTFDMDNVWSSVGGPRSGNRAPPPSAVAGKQESTPQTSGDADIDRMLNDDEEEPYSPTDDAPDLDAPVWEGLVEMLGVAEIQGSAKFVAGANLSSKYPWKHLMPPKIIIKGRIPVETANSYLCGLRYSSTADVSVVSITATEDPRAQSELEKLCIHLSERSRFGVLQEPDPPIAEAKDMYLVPVQPGMGNKPAFVQLLADCNLPDNISERMLLAVFVFKTPALPNGQQVDGAAPDNHVAVQPPVASTPVGPQASPFPPANGQQHPAMLTHSTPSQGQPPSYHPPAPYQQQQQQPPTTGYQPSPFQPQQSPVGIEAARQCMTPEQINCGSLQQLLDAAPRTTLKELEIIRETFDRVPATKNDYMMLVQILGASMNAGPS